MLRRIVPLFVAALMLVCTFSACNRTPDKGVSSTTASSSRPVRPSRPTRPSRPAQDNQSDALSAASDSSSTPDTSKPDEPSDIPSAPDGDDDDEDKPQEIRPEGNSAYKLTPMSGGADKEADALRSKILSAANTPKANGEGKTYYISPDGDDSAAGTSPDTAWESLEMAFSETIESGDTVLFERDGIWRASSSLRVTGGVTLGSYGEGEKPAIYGSSMNYAYEGLWEPTTKKYVWKTNFMMSDAGVIIFNHGEAAGDKQKNMYELQKNGDFYHNTDDQMLYLYCDKGYPENVYKDIEIGTNFHLITLAGDNITIDNLALKYCGAHAIRNVVKNPDNISITNCEIGFIGGSLLNSTSYLRFGNAIELWETGSNIRVENNWIYQIYDTAVSPQGNEACDFKNIYFENNLIEYTGLASFEFWLTGTADNIHFDNNISRFAGYGWGAADRPGYGKDLQFHTSLMMKDMIKNSTVKNNIFDCGAQMIVNWPWSDDDTSHPGVSFGQNSYYKKASPFNNTTIAAFGQLTGKAANQAELETAVKLFDSNPKLIKWLG